MNRKTGFTLTIITIILCGLPGILTALGGIFVTSSGFLADKAQLKLDTNLDQSSVILTGVGGVCLGLVLIAIPILIWLWSRRH
jgi:predicted ABC-type sugar transport system permease subunit